MEFKYREEIVGKRFLSVRSPGKLKLARLHEWEWRSGVVRAVSDKIHSKPDLNVLVEFEDVPWERREWVRIHDIYQVFLVENTLVGAHRPHKNKQKTLWPALNFTSIVDEPGVCNWRLRPIEFLVDRHIDFVDASDVSVYKEGAQIPFSSAVEVSKAIKDWVEYQDGQSILLTTPSVLIGYRIEVYRAEGTTQWYTAVIQGYNETTRELTVTDDTVLEEHNEDPGLIQIKLLGDGVVDSILKGVDIGITPRRRSCKEKSQDNQAPNTTSHREAGRVVKSSNRAVVSKPSSRSRVKLTTNESDIKGIVEKKAVERKPKPSRRNKNKPELKDVTSRKPIPLPKQTKSNSKTDENPVEDITVPDKTDGCEPEIRRTESDPRGNSTTESVKTETIEADNSKSEVCKLDRISDGVLSVIEEIASGGGDIDFSIYETKAFAPVTTKRTRKSNKNCDLPEKKSDKSANSNDTQDPIVKVKKPRKPNRRKQKKSADNEHVEGLGETDDMHFKKAYLLNESREKEKEKELNLNQSITDQIAKLAKGDSSGKCRHEETVDLSQRHINNVNSDTRGQHSTEYRSPEMNKTLPDMRSDVRRNDNLERSSSQASDERSSSRSSEKRPGSQHDDLRRSSKSSPANSPLLLDKAAPVQPYRDPELLKRDLETRQQQMAIAAQTGIRHGSSTPHTSYGPVHTPIPSHATTHAAHSNSRPLALQHYTPQHLAALQPHLLHAASVAANAQRLDASSLAAGDLTRMAVAQQQQVAQLMAQQYGLIAATQPHLFAAAAGYNSLHSNVTHAQLELLWRQKFPTIPIPPAWMLTQYQEELLRDVNMLHEQEVERQRRLEAERLERDRLERVERDRKERERERHERDEKERAEQRQRAEKERRERMEKEQRVERERILKESISIDTREAVDQHFTESLRLASQKAKIAPTGTWTPSIISGRGKPPPGVDVVRPKPGLPPSGGLVTNPEEERKRRDQIKQEIERERRRQEEHFKLEQKFGESKVTEAQLFKLQQEALKATMTDPKMMGYPTSFMQSLASFANAASVDGRSMKQEPNFSIYGYPGYPHSYLPMDKLTSAVAEKAKEEMRGDDKKKIHSPPPLIKDAHKGVIVENKSIKQERPSSPRSRYPLSPPSAYGQPMSALRQLEAQMNHSPLNMSSSSPTQHHPMDLGKKSNTDHKQEHKAPASYHNSGYPPYHLIHKGLVPNPIYNQSSALSSTKVSETDSDFHGAKRRINKDAFNKKRVKTESHSEPQVKVPETTPQIPTNSNPYTTNSSEQGSSMSPHNAGYIDSFRSFVENAVQTAFFQDEELNRRHIEQMRHHEGSTGPKVQQRASSEPPKDMSITAPPSIDVNISPTSLPSTMTPVTSMLTPPGSAGATSTGSNVSSSIMETINRVVHGGNDTDSDTMSAPSPPPHIKNEAGLSPNKSGNARFFKKAWLDRLSDEDKSKDGASPKNGPADSPDSEECRKEPIFPVVRKSGADVDTSSSTSGNESQGMDSQMKRKVKTKKRKSNVSRDDSKKPRSDSPVDSDILNKKMKQARKEENKVMKKEVKLEEKMGKKLLHDKLVEMSRADSRASNSDSEASVSSVKRRNKKTTKELSIIDLKTTTNNNVSFINKPLNKLSIAQLKKTNEPFLQEGPCADVTPKLMKCRECKLTPNQRNKKVPNIFCRFYAFRRLRYSQKGYIMLAGFSEPHDAEIDDIAPWLPQIPVISPQIDVDTAKYIITHVGDRFCELVEQEREALMWKGNDQKVAWKRAVHGVREMCDVCDTTLFNMHWVCDKCGFVVCLDCYKVKKDSAASEYDYDYIKEEDQKWITCSSNRQSHKPDKLMLTQIIPGNALWDVGTDIHRVRTKWGIKSQCPCSKKNGDVKSSAVPKNGVSQLLNAVNHCLPETKKPQMPLTNGNHGDRKKLSASYPDVHKDSNSNGPLTNSMSGLSSSYGGDPLSLLADVADWDSEKNKKHEQVIHGVEEKVNPTEYVGPSQTYSVPAMTNGGSTNASHDFDLESGCGPECRLKKNHDPASCSTLRNLLTKKVKKTEENNKINTFNSKLSEIIESVVERNLPIKSGQEFLSPFKLVHYVPRNGSSLHQSPITTIEAHTLTETSVLYPDVPHSWLCEGRLLRLHDPACVGNFKLFQQQWRKGQPVLVSGSHERLNLDLWKPSTFSREFGHLENDLVNTRSGVVLIGQKMRHFWDGMESMNERLVDDNDEPMLLKLKDWPPGDDFAEILPVHFGNILRSLPLAEYTDRSGRLNLAARLPEFFVRPDLGPKMYNAYGSAKYPKDGTTNLHMDIADAVNIMVYVGIPHENRADHEASVLKAIDETGCDLITKRRIRESQETPGAIWQIFDAQDADKIRDLLNKVAKENGQEIEPEHDPIHDQSWYLNVELRDRLRKEYGVLGYTIVQCLGDAVFIPAGAPHQVRNLHSCVKVAEDFVSPEHLNHCFSLTQEFRHLSDTHSNHEDKLQVKNILYHSVKDAVAVLNEADPEDYK